MVVSPESVLAAEVIGATGGQGEVSGAVLWCDGRRAVDLPPAARVEVRRGAQPVLLARLRRPAGERRGREYRSFVHRSAGGQVRPAGRRLAGPGSRRGACWRCLRKSGSAASGSSTTRSSNSHPASTSSPARPARARPWSCPDSGCCSAARPTRAGSGQAPTGPASKAGCGSIRTARSPSRSITPAATLTTTGRRWCCCARSRPKAGRAPTPAGGPCRCRCSPTWPTTWSPCTARPTSSNCSSRAGSGPRSTGSPVPSSPGCSATTSGSTSGT